MKKYISSSWWLMFLHGALLTAILFLMMMSSYEDELYDQIVDNTIHDEMTDRGKVLSLLNQTHSLLAPRLELFGAEDYIGLRGTLFRSSDTHLLDAKGACGSHAHVLSRLLQRAGFEIRMAQMKCGQEWGCHILSEAKVGDKFVVLDALYNLSFEKENGRLASFDEVSENWTYFKTQLPSDYDHKYKYEDVRYTNWNKIPVVMPMIKGVLEMLWGDAIETFSIRAKVLNVYQAYLIVLLMLYSFLLAKTFLFFRNQRKLDS